MRPVSTVPAAIDALTELARDALATAGLDGSPVQVVDGQPRTQTEDDVIAIGFTGDPGEASVESTRTTEQITTSPDREAYEIVCLASSWRGDEDPKVTRDRVYEFINAINARLMADQTLGRMVTRCRLRSEALAQEQTDKGPVATVRFVVSVDAYTRA